MGISIVAGKYKIFTFSFFAAMMAGSIPFTGLIEPSSDKTPKNAASLGTGSLISPASLIIPIAIAKSKMGLFFFSSAGERLMMIFLSRSEEHTSELQSRGHLVCRLLLQKK